MFFDGGISCEIRQTKRKGKQLRFILTVLNKAQTFVLDVDRLSTDLEDQTTQNKTKGKEEDIFHVVEWVCLKQFRVRSFVGVLIVGNQTTPDSLLMGKHEDSLSREMTHDAIPI